MKKGLCWPDDVHWCVECCPPGCPLIGLLGEVKKGKKGCLGHNGKKTPEGLTQRPLCLEVDCLAGFSGEKETIRQAISVLPPGEFKMTRVLKELKNKRRICA